jgi:hypothetical protein
MRRKMKTLHSIFLKDFLKNYAKISFFSILAIVIAINTLATRADSNFISFTNTLAFIAAFIGPFAIFFMDNNFPHNIKWLINQHFSRSDLVKFFFIAQTYKVILCLFLYLVILNIFNTFGNTVPDFLSLPKFNYLYSDFYQYFVIILSAIYIFYFATLFTANSQDVKRSKVMNKNKSKKSAWLWLAFFLALIHITIHYSLPDVIKGYFWSFFVIFSALAITNRTFRLSEVNNFRIFSAKYSFAFCLPIVVLTILMRGEAINPKVPYKLRAESVVSLGWLNKEMTPKEMISFLDQSGDDFYKELLIIFNHKVDFGSSLSVVKTDYQAQKFMDIQTRPQSEMNVKKVVEHMNLLQKTVKFQGGLKYSTRQFFMKQKMDMNYIKGLMSSQNKYKQFVSIYLAKNSFSKKDFVQFYESNEGLMKKEIFNDPIIKRTIASIKEKKTP